MKIKNTVCCLIAAVALNGCVTLTGGLEQVNTLLGQATSALNGGQSYSVPDKITSEYEVRNLKLNVEKVSDSNNIKFSGQAYNKTNKLLRLNIAIPVYNPGGFYARDVNITVTVPPKEKSLVDNFEPFAFKDGQKLNIQKIQYNPVLY